MPEKTAGPRLLVGVSYNQADVVFKQAAIFARRFGAALVCAHVDLGRYVVEERADGSVVSLPLDPDLPELGEQDFDPELASSIRGAVGDDTIDLSFRELAGDTAYALARLADILDVEMIIVGSRRQGVRAGIRQFFGGSVAAQLAHRQARPVVVVPVAPVAPDKPLPWEDTPAD